MREQRYFSLKEGQRQTGIAWGKLCSWANNRVACFDAPVIEALCDYLDCEVGDLIVFEQ